MEDLERLEEDLELLQALSFCLWTSKEHEDHFRLTNVQKFLMKSFRYSSDFEVKEKLLFCCCLWIFPQFTESGCFSPGERLTLTLTSHPQPVCLHTQTNVLTVWARGPTGWPQLSGGGDCWTSSLLPVPPPRVKPLSTNTVLGRVRPRSPAFRTSTTNELWRSAGEVEEGWPVGGGVHSCSNHFWHKPTEQSGSGSTRREERNLSLT